MGQGFSLSKRTLKRGSNCSQEVLSCLCFDCFHLISGQCIHFWEQKILIRESKSLCDNIFFSPLLSRFSFFFISGGCSHITLPNMLKYMILRAVLFRYECVCVCCVCVCVCFGGAGRGKTVLDCDVICPSDLIWVLAGFTIAMCQEEQMESWWRAPRLEALKEVFFQEEEISE